MSSRPPSEVMSASDVGRALVRMAHEIVERHRGAESLYLVGIRTRGVPIARRLAAAIGSFESVTPPVGVLDVRAHRDDVADRGVPEALETDLPVSVTDRSVVLVDEVIYTGRTTRSALDALMEQGRPQRISLAVLVDRGHRELPISPDFVGRNIPTSRLEVVRVELQETDGRDRVILLREGVQ